MNANWRAGAGGGVLHAVPIAAITLLVINDHWLKATWGHPLTGKLSDVAGLAFAPLLLVAVFEVAQASCGRFRLPSDRLLVVAIVATGVVFSLVQLSPPATETYRLVLAALQQPHDVARLVIAGAPLEAFPRVRVTPDAWDLLALPALLLSAWIGRATSRGSSAPADVEQSLALVLQAYWSRKHERDTHQRELAATYVPGQYDAPMAATADPFVQHVLDQLERVAPVSVRSMFGGHGFYLDGVMFALIAYGTLYFKVGDANRGAYEAAGCGPFVYEGRGRPIRISYYELPVHVLDDLELLESWLRAAHAVAVEAKAQQGQRQARPRP